MNTVICPPNEDYLELNFVGQTATGKGNNQRFIMENNGDGTFKATEARVGITIGRHRPRSWNMPMEEWARVYEEKVRRGYLLTKNQKMDALVVSKSKYSPIEDNDVNEIVNRLLQYANAVMESSYTVKVEDISDEMIHFGKQVLDELAEKYDRMSVAEFNAKLNTLFAAIPRRMDNLSKFQAKRKSEFTDIIAGEQELYDIMVSQVRSAGILKESAKPPTVLEAYGLKWRKVTADEEKMLKKILGSESHGYLGAWRIVNEHTEKAFDGFCSAENLNTSGISHLFHGSRSENFWSIVTNGLTINPSGVVITGKMFGNGTYFAPLAKKSLGYTSRAGSRWAGGHQNSGFLAVYKVATGTHYDIDAAQTDLNWKKLQERCPGAHCTWAHAGNQLYNDEVIVYQDNQSTIEYLIEIG